MATWTKQKRDALPASDFGDPERKLFPIEDQDDVDSAAHLVGKAHDPAAVQRRIVAIARRKGLRIPDAWKDEAQHSTAAFTIGEPTTEGDYVLRSGKLFEAGEYPDKRFSLTPEELQAAVADFAPVPVDLEHERTPFLDGKLGELRSVQLGDDGWSLVGTVALPRWLDAALEGTARKVSTTWDRATKRLTGLAIVEHPRVADAALMSAYAAFAARHDTLEGQSTLQDLHDTAARRGAVCRKPAQMASQHEAAAVQQIHDLAVEHGARCRSIADGPRPLFSQSAAGATGAHSSPKETHRMSVLDRIAALFARIPEAELEAALAAPEPSAAAATLSAPASAQLEAARREATDAQAELARLRDETAERDAAAFADRVIADRRALPAQKDALVAAYRTAATDDAAHGTVRFGEGEPSSRVAQLEALFAAAPQHQITGEQVAIVENRPETEQPADDAPARMSAERRRELLALSDLGRQVLAAEAAAAK